MIKVVTIIGARPQIIKSAALSRAIRNSFADKINEVLLHTGQHYDTNMSDVFFGELDIPKPDYNLHIGADQAALQTARMIIGVQEILEKENPDWLVVYGDTNSTLAGAIAANKCNVPLIHVEAGLRSFNKSMPEENNRIVADQLSTLLFCPTQTGMNNLANEGYDVEANDPISLDKPGIFNCGDIMYDNSLHFGELAGADRSIMEDNGLENEAFIFFTCHRPVNTDNPENLTSILECCCKLADLGETFFMPLHPRTKKAMRKLSKDLLQRLNSHERIIIHDPISFLEVTLLEKECKMIMTDSGGIQKEAYFFHKPCIVLREETEWVELIETGNSVLVGAKRSKILEAFSKVGNEKKSFPSIFGNGNTAEAICKKIIALT